MSPVFRHILALALAFWLGIAPGFATEQASPLRVRVIGGFAGTSQFDRIEQPFWTRRLPALTGGRMVAMLQSSTQAGVSPDQMLNVMRSGAVLFGTVEANAIALDEPELAVADLPLLAEDTAALRRMVALWRPRFHAIFAEQYGAELLAVFIRPPQVVFCNKPFTGLRGLAGLRVRAASVNQADLLLALGAQPVVMAFDRMVGAVREGLVDCAITGGLPGQAVGLHRVTTHVSSLPLGWAMSFLTAHQPGWQALPAGLREQVQQGVAELEAAMWNAAEEERDQGEACNTGDARCRQGERGRLVAVREDPAAIRPLFGAAVLPGWARRCGATCAESWNAVAGPAAGVYALW
ncbi:TRAP transporter substrate-binding protein DctP [Belnapia sp. T18]|uniref:TRAP transporter substrate-binding protein DctP n=1 Tax=Belnapia arida TaxID=2804533 RepID=A0ABS1U3D7_9PROT|nr:TRAP transporter substrate-binding protein DctP [Belnapia arida]MBL6078232.1 TRAP transporter substrate-binding protein DctP [Belnapia arida]